MELINKDALVAEINRQIELLKPFLGSCAGQIVAEANAKLSVLEKLNNLLDTLEVKEVDLEKEIDNIWKPRFNLGWDEKSLLSINHEGFTTIAKHFFELGLKAQKGE